MKKSNGMNALLMELVIVLFFFVLAFTVLSQIYAHAFLTEQKAALKSEALFEAQNVSACLRGAREPRDVLKKQGFELTEAGWQKDFDGFCLQVQVETDEKQTGVCYRAEVEALYQEQTLFVLPASVYVQEVSR